MVAAPHASGAAQVPRSSEFRRERSRSWRQLERLLERAEKRGVAGLSQAELARLPALHRATVSALSVARATSLDRNLLEYLEGLTARSFFFVYGTRRHLRETLRRFFAESFPRAARRFRAHLALSALILALGVAAGFFLTLADPNRFYAFVGSEMASGRDPTATTEELRAVLYQEVNAGEALTAFASFLFTHNSQIAILCFALGFAAGLPVFVLVLTNGMMLGAFAALYHSHGLSLELWAWLLPHGVTELLALVVAGGAGLALADALIFPGRHGRLENLARAGRQAGVLMIGCVCMAFLAALVEGYFRQLVQHVGVRYGLALATAVFWTLYLTRAGRGSSR